MRYITDIEEFSSLTTIMGSCNWAPEKQRNGISPTVKYTDWSELYREHGFDFILPLAKRRKSEIFYFFTLSHYKLAQYFLTFKLSLSRRLELKNENPQRRHHRRQRRVYEELRAGLRIMAATSVSKGCIVPAEAYERLNKQAPILPFK